MRDLIEDFQEWLTSVPPEILFLMVLPAAVAAAGLWAVRAAAPVPQSPRYETKMYPLRQIDVS